MIQMMADSYRVTPNTPRFASGTGLAGVPGSESGDTQPAMLTPREIVLNPAESDVMRTLAKMGGIDYDRLAAVLVKAIQSMSFKMDGREVVKAVYDRSRSGHVVAYGRQGVTTAK